MADLKEELMDDIMVSLKYWILIGWYQFLVIFILEKQKGGCLWLEEYFVREKMWH